MAKAQLEFKLDSTMGNDILFFSKYVNSTRRIRDNTGSLLDEDGRLTNRDIDKVETFNAFFTSVFSTPVMASWWTMTAVMINSQATPNLCGISCSN